MYQQEHLDENMCSLFLTFSFCNVYEYVHRIKNLRKALESLRSRDERLEPK